MKRAADRVQGDLFAWATPRPKAQRLGWMNSRVDCVIGPHWWFSNYLAMPDYPGGKIIPDLKSPIDFRHHQLREPDDQP